MAVMKSTVPSGLHLICSVINSSISQFHHHHHHFYLVMQVIILAASEVEVDQVTNKM